MSLKKLAKEKLKESKMAIQSENICKELFAAGDLRIEVHMDSEMLREHLVQLVATSLVDTYESTIWVIENEDESPEYKEILLKRLEALDTVIKHYTFPQQYEEWKKTGVLSTEYFDGKKASEEIKCTYVDG